MRHSYGKPEGHTTVEITQSQGYEIKEVPQEYPQTYSQNFVRFPGQAAGHQAAAHQARHQAEEEVPVIVLKVPGPTKYAAHLRTLLQQYLEIRAAQVIRELEQQEQIAAEQYHQQQLHNQALQYRQQQHHHQIQQQMSYQHQGLQTHVQYATPASVAAEEQLAYHHQNQHQYQQQINSHGHIESEDEGHHHGHAVYGNQPSPAPEESPQQYLQGEYEPTAQVGQTVYEDHQTHYIPNQQSQGEVSHQEYYYQQQQAHQHQQSQEQHQVYHQQENPHPGHIRYAAASQEQQEQPQYAYQAPAEDLLQQHQHQQQAQEQHVAHEESSSAGYNNHDQEESHLETPENFPDEKHTRVVFTKNLSNRPHHHRVHHHEDHAEQVISVTPEKHHYQGPHYLPTPVPTHEEYAHEDHSAATHLQQHEHQQQQQQEQGLEEHQHQNQLHHELEEYQAQSMATPGPFITITQKRKQNRVPFNYHAHGRVSTPPPRKRETPYTEDQFNKFSKLVNRLKKKQTMLINERTKKSPSEQKPQ